MVQDLVCSEVGISYRLASLTNEYADLCEFSSRYMVFDPECQRAIGSDHVQRRSHRQIRLTIFAPKLTNNRESLNIALATELSVVRQGLPLKSRECNIFTVIKALEDKRLENILAGTFGIDTCCKQALGRLINCQLQKVSAMGSCVWINHLVFLILLKK